jgi:hypothetical protein
LKYASDFMLKNIKTGVFLICIKDKPRFLRLFTFPKAQNTLVAAASKGQAGIVKGTHKGAIHQHIHVIQRRQEHGIGLNLLPRVTRVAPNVHAGGLLYPLRKGAELLGVKQGVAAREGDAIQQGIGVDLTDEVLQAILGEGRAGRGIPRLRVVTAGTVMTASGQINGKPDALTVYYSLGISVQ